ncbi:hypothetical protein GGC65_002175 [Sphingopyxis sp. OAS728]|uniref:hypothetical protein n=1 Tax=Sphingopyxis sp. OAS728 TaxID=2663823 RepID=UPI00178AF2D3|nr:hypothetical protein [Sphingopyxis sp. OAS728]MBE1527719.1 hypothetical protein [Sphingopyxis sp. OAS728]
MKRLTLLLLLCGAAVSTAAAPPPPPVYPDDLPRTLDGYDLGVVYSRYSFWIEGRKGEVIDAVMAEPAEVADHRLQFVAPVSFSTNSDYGHFQSGDIRSYCRVTGEGDVDHNDCQFVFRIVTIPAAAIDRAGPVGIFLRESFDPAAVVASMKANGVTPDADLWRVDGRLIFGTLASPAKLLRDNVQVETVESRQCPAMQRALEAIEGRAVPSRIDIPLIGDDGPMPPPVPHAAVREDRLTFVTDGGSMTVTSWRGLQPLLGPVYAAVDTCLRSRRAAGG